MEVKDISVEIYRTYVYSDGSEYTIDKPRTLHLTGSNGHRVVDADGVAHLPQKGWLAIRWDTWPTKQKVLF